MPSTRTLRCLALIGLICCACPTEPEPGVVAPDASVGLDSGQTPDAPNDTPPAPVDGELVDSRALPCACGPTRCEIGAVFADGCQVCECTAQGVQCTLVGCEDAGSCGAGGGVYFPGCEEIRRCGHRLGGPPPFAARDYCGCDGVTFRASTPDRPYQHVGACAGTTDDACSRCGPEEVCVQLNDSSTQCASPRPTLACRRVSAACRGTLDQIVGVGGSCYRLSRDCQTELCAAPYQCMTTPPCGNESARARVWCYGP